MNHPPYRLASERLVVRCWQPVDAPLLDEAVASSIEHLQPRMPWVVREPVTRQERVQYLRGARGCFDRDDGVLRRRPRTPAGNPRDTTIWSLFADELAGSPCANIEYRAFDASGELLAD